MEFEIFFNDLTDEAQLRLLELYDTNPSDENWDTIPLVIINREEE